MTCRHEESMWGRCVACGLTWEGQVRKRAAEQQTSEEDADQTDEGAEWDRAHDRWIDQQNEVM